MSAWDVVKSLIRNIAPTITTVIGGPLAGNAVAALGNVLLGKSDPTPEELADAIKKATPEQLLALKQLDLQFAQLDNDDRQRAADMYTAYVEKTGKSDWIMKYITIWATGMFSAVIFLSPWVNDLFEKSILTFLFNLVTNVFSFFCGRNTK